PPGLLSFLDRKYRPTVKPARSSEIRHVLLDLGHRLVGDVAKSVDRDLVVLLAHEECSMMFLSIAPSLGT
ncbi:MAG: hypothetical protein O7A68_12350, partial [Alphaproteobacteria bacterium]|nr:hypothetical protein [Alphaproteobacteria bacterium]